MYTNSYQSGTFLELYNSQSKDLTKHWKFSGQIVKDYDQYLKNYTTNLINGGSSKLQIPINDKITLGIVQGYIVFQLFVFSLKSFSIEIFISDTSKTRRRIIFSTNTKDIIINSMHCRIPLVNLTLNTWINLSIDVISFVSECFKTQTFRSIEYISITGNCKLKRILSMRNTLYNYPNDFNDNNKDVEMQNKLIGFPPKLPYENLNFNIDKVKNYVDNDIANKCSQLMTKNVSNAVANNNYTNALKRDNNNIVVITNNNSKRANQGTNNAKKLIKGSNSRISTQKNVVFVSRKEINELGKSPNNIRSKSNNPTKTKDKSNHKSNDSSTEKSSSIHKVLLSVDKNSNEIQKNYIEINIIDPNDITQDKNLSIKKNNFTFEGNNSINKKSYSLEKSLKNLQFYSPYNNKSIKNTENHDESIEELYDIEDNKNNLNEIKNHNNTDLVNSRVNNNHDYNEINLSKISENPNDKYYDIPIMDKKGKSTFKKTDDNFQTDKQKPNIVSKKELLDEILNENDDMKFGGELERPYTPPITKLINMKTILPTNNELKESSITPMQINNDKIDNDCRKTSYPIGEENYIDLVYDPAIGYYYDPKKNIYYEVKHIK